MRRTRYSEQFFSDLTETTRTSAEVIVPLVIELVAPSSVIDLGCGVGTWLAAFARHGVDDYLGVDGDWVPSEALEIPGERFKAARLDHAFNLDRGFDLAVSLEVAEHLPETAAAQFVGTIVRLAPCVLFSAAIPNQRGQHHVNEQWPEYWASLFADRGYAVIDAIRPRVWSAPDVAWWYSQNTLLFARPEVLAARPSLARERDRTVESMLSLVHPQALAVVVAERDRNVGRLRAREHSLSDVLSALPSVAARSVRWRIGRLRRRARRRS